jgi:hypothetical protein
MSDMVLVLMGATHASAQGTRFAEADLQRGAMNLALS